MRGTPHSAFPISSDVPSIPLSSAPGNEGTKHVSGLPSCGLAQQPLALSQREKRGAGGDVMRQTSTLKGVNAGFERSKH
jgi:hypothetical protein